MIGKLTSIENGPQRNVRLVITPVHVWSEISSPAGRWDPCNIDYYEVSGLRQQDHGLITLTLVLTNKQRVQFYSTEQKADMALLLDQLDGTIGERRREVPRENA